MGSDQDNPIDRTQAIAEDFRNQDDAVGGMSFSGVCGYHTYFNSGVENPEELIEYATKTALHAAFDKAMREIWISADIIEEEFGELTPETAAKELELQLQEHHRIDTEFGWARRLIDEFEDNLRSYEHQLRIRGVRVNQMSDEVHCQTCGREAMWVPEAGDDRLVPICPDHGIVSITDTEKSQ